MPDQPEVPIDPPAASAKQLLTHSRVQSFKTCRKRHWWEYEIGLRSAVDAKALRMGSAGHDGLDVLKLGRGIEAAVATVRDHYRRAPEAIDQYDWNIERETVECLIRGYYWRWKESLMAIVVSEQTLRAPLRNPLTGAASTLWELAGKVDGIARLEDTRLAVLEHKFIGESIEQDSDYWRRLQLDSQPTTYVHLARQNGHDVSTVLYDLIRKPTIKPERIPLRDDDGFKIVLDAFSRRVMTKQDKPRQTGSNADGYVLQTRPMTPLEWGGKLLKDIGERPGFYYARHEIARLDQDVDECLRELWDIQKTLRDAQRANRWYRTVGRDSCPWCPWFGLCSSKYDPANNSGIPEGFVKLDNVHPELEKVS
ncbi:hypothetical protein LCGC14_1662070 [marine sediment metagenome]|uniref:PD-(D/E)XK endonuclease-like domain-containing protein n=1 Tax=marine sediment metagenome TaxID=412755 RepID=A0A0F9IG76_9ZZZZ